MTAGKRLVDFALLDEKLQLLDLSTRPLDELLHEVETHAQIAVAVDAPARLNAGLLSRPQVRRQLGLTDGSARWANHRVAEYELRRRGLNLYVTPRSQSKAPARMRQGFAAYRRLSASGFALGAQEVPPLQWAFEVYPHASFAGLLGHVPFPKAALEGRVQRQLVLYREGLQVTDPLLALEELTAHHLLAGRLELAGLLDHDALDALVAAFTAWLAWVRPERVTWGGPSRRRSHLRCRRPSYGSLRALRVTPLRYTSAYNVLDANGTARARAVPAIFDPAQPGVNE